MESSKSANTRASQFEVMVQYMTKHPDLSKGYLKTPEARQKSKHLWTNLCNKLNAEGPPQRDVVGWKKVWADFKVHTKAKLRKNKINLSGTGGGPPKYFSLTPLEEKVSELLDLHQAIDGMDTSLSFGLNDSNCNREEHADDIDTVIAEAEDALGGSHQDAVVGMEFSVSDILSGEKENVQQSRTTPKKRQFSLLEKQVENQITYQNNLCDEMKEVNNNLKGILKYTKRDYELKEKTYKLKKEKLQLQKEKFEFNKKTQVEKTKNTITKLELKRDILRFRQEINEK